MVYHLKGRLHSGRFWAYQQTFAKLEKLARDKHSSLLQTFVNYGRRKVLQHLAPEANIIKLFTDVIYEFSQ